MPYQVFGSRSGATVVTIAWMRSAIARSASSISAILSRRLCRSSAFFAPFLPSALSSAARSFIAARSASVNPLASFVVVVMTRTLLAGADRCFSIPDRCADAVEHDAQPDPEVGVVARRAVDRAGGAGLQVGLLVDGVTEDEVQQRARGGRHERGVQPARGQRGDELLVRRRGAEP